MSRIMILGANILQVPLITQANEDGFKTIVVSPNTEEVGHKLATYSVQADVRNEQEIYKYARDFNIAGIITDQTDIAVRSVAYVAEKMNLPGIGYDVACLFTDKYKMREKCKELNIRTLKYKKVQNITDALEFFDELGEKVILKPVDNQGSKGVALIDSPEKMRR